MSEASDNLVLEMLQAIRATLGEQGDRLGAIEQRLTALDIGLAAIRRDMAADSMGRAEQSLRMDGLDARLARVERRVELRDL